MSIRPPERLRLSVEPEDEAAATRMDVMIDGLLRFLQDPEQRSWAGIRSLIAKSVNRDTLKRWWRQQISIAGEIWQKVLLEARLLVRGLAGMLNDPETPMGLARAGAEFAAFLLALVLLGLVVQIPLHTYARLKLASELGVGWHSACTQQGNPVLVIDTVKKRSPMGDAEVRPGDAILMNPDELVEHVARSYSYCRIPVRRGDMLMSLEIEAPKAVLALNSLAVYELTSDLASRAKNLVYPLPELAMQGARRAVSAEPPYRYWNQEPRENGRFRSFAQ